MGAQELKNRPQAEDNRRRAEEITKGMKPLNSKALTDAEFSRDKQADPKFLTRQRMNQLDSLNRNIDASFGEKEWKNNLPGGQALKSNQKSQPVKGADNAGENAETKKPNLLNRLIGRANNDPRLREENNPIRKTAKEAAKKIAKAALAVSKFFATYWIPIVAILILVLGIVLFTYLIAGRGGSPSPEGKSHVQAASPVENKDWIAKFAGLSGMKDIKEEDLDEYFNGLLESLNGIESELSAATPKNDEVIALIEKIKGEIAAYRTSKNDKVGQEIIKDVNDLMGKINVCSQLVTNPKKNGSGGAIFNIKNTDDKNGLKTGVLTRKDGTKTPADQSMCRFLITIVNKAEEIGVKQYNVAAIARKHSKNVKGTDRVSMHYYGKGIDFGNEEIGAVLMPWIVKNSGYLKSINAMPKQVIGPKRYSQSAVNKGQNAPGFTAPGHEDHIHIGF